MNRRTGRRASITALSFAALFALGTVGTVSAGVSAAALKDYANCTKLNKDYPHGVGRKHAHDKTSSGSPKVTTFYRNNALYRLNKESDRDGDKIACEKL